MTEALTVPFCGEDFRIADKIGLMPMMRFAKVAQAGVDSADLAGLAAMYDLLEQCLADDEWQRFSDHADKSRADGDELMAVVGKVFEELGKRPTSRSSDSSDGPPPTSERSTAGSSPALRLLDGRPDLQVAVLRAQEALSA